jgi:hypothetical protein
MKYADLELSTRGDFPHGMTPPGLVPKMDQNLPQYFHTWSSTYLWPANNRAGDQWDDLQQETKHHDLHMYYTLAWWKLGEGVWTDFDD